MREGHSTVMKMIKVSVIFALGFLLGIGVAGVGYGLHNHINFAKKAEHLRDHAVAALDRVFGARVRAAKLANIVPPGPYFPPGAIWTQDISHAPLDPRSSTIIAWLADAGGWGNNNKMQIDFSMRVLQADANTPTVPFRKGSNWAAVDSDSVSVFPLPTGGGAEGEPDYQCELDQQDCHIIVADRSQGKLYEAFQATYEDHALTADFLAVWDLNRVYPPSGRGDQCSSADAAGFPIAPLLFNADEIATGSINHAIRFILPNPRIRAHVFVHPATHAGGPTGPEDAPPMGARFRLKAPRHGLSPAPCRNMAYSCPTVVISPSPHRATKIL
jgi:hypothetical protein